MSLALSYIRDALPTTRQFFPSRWQLVQGWSRVETSQRTLRDLQERQACIDRGRLKRRGFLEAAIGSSGAIATKVIVTMMAMGRSRCSYASVEGRDASKRRYASTEHADARFRLERLSRLATAHATFSKVRGEQVTDYLQVGASPAYE